VTVKTETDSNRDIPVDKFVKSITNRLESKSQQCCTIHNLDRLKRRH